MNLTAYSKQMYMNLTSYSKQMYMNLIKKNQKYTE